MFKNKAMDGNARAAMQEMRLSGTLCDVILVSGTVEVAAHSLVLASVSQYFRDRFNEQSMDINSNKMSIEGLNPEVLELLVEYVYTSKVLITENNVESLLAGSTMLKMLDLVKICSEFKGRKSFNPNAMLAIGGNRVFMMETYNFKENQWSDLGNLESILTDHDVAVVGNMVYRVGGKKNGDPQSFMDMYDPNTDTWTFNLWEMDPRILDMGVTVMNDRIYAVGGYSNELCHGNYGKWLDTAKVLDLAMDGSKKWSKIADMNIPRRYVGVGTLYGKVYAVGGHEGFGCNEGLSSVECYDPLEKDEWTYVADLSVPRYGAGVGALNGFLYCIGGANSTDKYHEKRNVLKSVEKYNPDTNTWSPVAEMNESRIYPGVVSHEGRLYVVGGVGQDDILNSMEMYDPETDSWTMMAPMSNKRVWFGVALVQRPS